MKRKTPGTKRVTTPAKSSKPKTHDDYLAAVTEDKRDALQKLRKAIKMAAPKAEECISYQLPAFRLNGKFLVAYGAATNHCAFYPGSTVKALSPGPEVGKAPDRKGRIMVISYQRLIAFRCRSATPPWSSDRRLHRLRRARSDRFPLFSLLTKRHSDLVRARRENGPDHQW